ncbi:MAG: LVIVD repeat-containing protein [Gaiellaceae bacterium]
MQKLRLLIAFTVVLVATVVPLTASAVPPEVAEATATFEYTQNLHPVGYSARVVETNNDLPGAGSFNSDLAFWGKTAVQGTYAGFRLIDISAPGKPKEIVNWEECNSLLNTQGNQGDVIIWGDLIIRSWNSGTPAPIDPATGLPYPVENPARYTTPGSFCGDWPMFREPAAPPLPERGQEGVHIIDISDPKNPDVIGFVDTPCGSHTETLVPDLKNNRLLVYNNPSSGNVFGGDPGGPTPVSCAGMDIVEVPLDDPASASYLKFVPAGDPSMPAEEHHPCHDSAVILGKVLRLACAGVPGAAVFSLDPADGGDLDDPVFLYNADTITGVGIGHSASFTWDGKYLIIGHEPGGGSGARCEATDPEAERTFFFHDVETGEQVGKFVIPRPQTNVENCTTHNYNVVPLRKRYVMVSGNYQSGISVIDFTDPANAEEIAYADPAPIVDPNPPVGIELGGDWSSYWYNGEIYESDILRGLIIWKLSDRAVAGAMKLSHLNPQTQETSLRSR